MSIINANNTLSFKSSVSLFSRIKKRLSKLDSEGLIDDGDFHKHVVYIYSLLGEALFKECQAVIHVDKYGKAKLPPNFYRLYAAYKCNPYFNEPKSINEQKPLIYYSDVEIGCESSDNRCCITCAGDSKTKIVVRTYVQGEPSTCYYRNPILLKVSPNVREQCTEDCLSIIPSAMDEITFDGEGNILANFKNDSIYLQYFGTPLDENGLPMIPQQEIVERAIEYYIYSQLFEEMLWNSNVANIGPMLADARNQYENTYLPQALYWAKLPSFQAMVNSTRRMRHRNKFYYFLGDKTISYTDLYKKC